VEHEAEEGSIPGGEKALQEVAMEIFWGEDLGLSVAFDFHTGQNLSFVQ
jgi:hypothetical protein